jgi:hypothetical protein
MRVDFGELLLDVRDVRYSADREAVVLLLHPADVRESSAAPSASDRKRRREVALAMRNSDFPVITFGGWAIVDAGDATPEAARGSVPRWRRRRQRASRQCAVEASRPALSQRRGRSVRKCSSVGSRWRCNPKPEVACRCCRRIPSRRGTFDHWRSRAHPTSRNRSGQTTKTGCPSRSC